MSLPRGSHSNCGSQPSGWEPFFFTLKQPALVFLRTKKSALVLHFSDLPSFPAQFMLCKSACAAPESHNIGGLAFLYTEGPRGASQDEGNKKIRCGACNCSPSVGAQGHRRPLISPSEEISAVQHRLLSQPLTLAFSTVSFSFILRLLSKTLRGSQKLL